VRYRVKDPDGLVRDSVLAITVLSGTPVIDSLRPGTTWINDDSTYTIYARDNNGTIQKWFRDLDNNGVWDDSANVNTFSAHFNSAGNKVVRVGVRDEDSTMAVATYPINVHLGMPRVWNAQGDTLFVVCPEGGADVSLHINSFDTNGTVQKYYWDFNAVNGLDTNVTPTYKTDVDSITKAIDPGTVNVGYRMAIFGKDDDGNVAGDTMWLYPDAPPPAPTFFKDSTFADTTVLKWEAIHDVHDNLKTQVQIFIRQGTNGEPNIPLFTGTLPSLDDARFGSQTVGGVPCYNYKFKCSFAGAGRWRVVLQDARGSKTMGPGFSGDPASFVAP
jgi:hypothetical protein